MILIKVLFYTHYPPDSYREGGGALAIWKTALAVEKLPGVELAIAFVGAPQESYPANYISLNSSEELGPLVERTSPDVLHTFRPMAIAGIRVAKARNISVIHELRAPSYFPSKLFHLLALRRPRLSPILGHRANRKAARLADLCLVPSRFALQEMRRYYGVSESQSSFAYNGIRQAKPFSKPSVRRGKFVNAGRLEKGKGFDLVIQCFQMLRDNFPEITLDIVGDGSQREKLEKLSEGRHSEAITFHGSLPHGEVLRIMSDCEILLNGSRSESFGNVIAEAMSCGLVVVGFKVGSLSELVGDDEGGFLVKLGDLIALEQRCAELLVDSELVKKMSLRNLEKIKEFTWERRALKIQEHYKNLL